MDKDGASVAAECKEKSKAEFTGTGPGQGQGTETANGEEKAVVGKTTEEKPK